MLIKDYEPDSDGKAYIKFNMGSLKGLQLWWNTNIKIIYKNNTPNTKPFP